MRHSLSFAVAIAIGVSLMVAVVPTGSGAEEATPNVTDVHPLVGTWIVDDVDDPGPPSVTVFSADGIVLDTAPDRVVGAGTWEVTGPRTGALAFVVFDPNGSGGYVIVRARAEVDETGATFTAAYSFTVVTSDGTVVTSGRREVRGIRLEVEPLEAEGTPHAAFPAWLTTPAPISTPAA